MISDSLVAMIVITVSCFSIVAKSANADSNDIGVFTEPSMNQALNGDIGPQNYAVVWDFAGQYSNPFISSNDGADRLYRRLWNIYKQYDQIEISEGPLHLLRNTLPRDFSDPLPSKLSISPNLWSIHGPLQLLDHSSARALIHFGFEPLEHSDLNQLGANTLQRISAWRNSDADIPYMYLSEYFNGEYWEPLSNLPSNEIQYRTYRIRTILIHGNTIEYTRWQELPREVALCVAQLDQKDVALHNQGATVVSNDVPVNLFFEEILDIVQWSIIPAVHTGAKTCGAEPQDYALANRLAPDVEFTGFIDFGHGPHIGLFESEAKFPSYLPDSNN